MMIVTSDFKCFLQNKAQNLALLQNTLTSYGFYMYIQCGYACLMKTRGAADVKREKQESSAIIYTDGQRYAYMTYIQTPT